MDWLNTIRRCFDAEQVFYSGHARREMREEEYGPINDQEVYESVQTAEIIEMYPEDTPFPSVLIYGTTIAHRPLHAVCAYDDEQDQIIVVTVYQPDPARWEEYRRRKQ